MKQHKLIIVITLLATSFSISAQSDEGKKVIAAKAAAEKSELGWKKGGSLSLDLSGMGLFNPKVGSGGNRFGLGGIASLFINYKSGKSFWSNDLGIQLAAQRVQVVNTTVTNGIAATIYRNDFVKNLDILRLNSRFGYNIIGKNIFAAVDGMAQTFILPTYPGNTLKPINKNERATAKFLSPVTLTIAPGIAYNPDAHLSLFYSPAGVRYILVADNNIAGLYLHGNKVGQNYFLGLGSELKIGYTNKYFKDRVSVSSRLGLFSNYLNTPQNIDVLWNNTMDFQIFKGLSLSLLGELSYDNDVRVQIDRNKNGIYGETKATNSNLSVSDELAPAASMIGAFLLKYSRIF